MLSITVRLSLRKCIPFKETREERSVTSAVILCAHSIIVWLAIAE